MLCSVTERQEEDELVLQIVYVFYYLVLHQATRQTVLSTSRILCLHPIVPGGNLPCMFGNVFARFRLNQHDKVWRVKEAIYTGILELYTRQPVDNKVKGNLKCPRVSLYK